MHIVSVCNYESVNKVKKLFTLSMNGTLQSVNKVIKLCTFPTYGNTDLQTDVNRCYCGTDLFGSILLSVIMPCQANLF